MTTLVATPHRSSLGGGGNSLTFKHLPNGSSTTQQQQQLKYTCGGSFNKPLLIDNENLIIIAVSQTIKIYSNNTGKQINEIIHHKKKITQIIKDLSNEEQVYSVSEDGNLCLWRINFENNSFTLVKEMNISKPIYGIQQDLNNHSMLYLCISEHFYSIIKINISNLEIEYNLFQMINFTQMILSNNFLFIIGGVDLNIYNLKKQEIENTITNQGTNLTCITFCKENEIIAYGDGHGVISLLFSDGTKSSHHWHPSMVTNLQFSEEGDYLYSSGIEGVVVCWRLPSFKKDKFLITDCNISNFILSSNQDDILILGKDNIIRKYEFARFNLIYRIHGININLDNLNNNNIKIINEPNTNCILMNGTNSLQWFNINDSTVKHYESIQFRDVKYDPSRFINESKPIKSIIDHLSFSHPSTTSGSASLLAHVESFNNVKQNLKFWKLNNSTKNIDATTTTSTTTSDDNTDDNVDSGDSKKMKPKLITVIDNPHLDKITHLLFSINNTCLTSSLDGKIKIWKLINDIFKCQAILEYKNLPCYSFDISKDGTLLCAVFGSEVTLWDLERFELIESHNYPYQLLDCKFINDDYIAIISDRYISLFSLLFDNKNVWTIDAGSVQSLITNQNQFACIVNGSEIIEFNNIYNNYPNVNFHLDTDHFLQSLFYKNNQLYFLNKQFEIYNIINNTSTTTSNATTSVAATSNGTATTTTDREGKNIEIASIYDKKWKTNERISLMELQKVKTAPFSTDMGNRAWKDIFSAPSHSLISMSSCYSTFMNTFVLKSSNQKNDETNTNNNTNNYTSGTSTPAQYATLVPNTQLSNQQQQQQQGEESCVPCADLIRFINTYSKQ